MLLRNGYKYITTKFQILNYLRLRAKTFAMGGSYKTICPLGKGNFGVVRKMLHEPSGKELAVKSIPYTFNSQDEEQQVCDRADSTFHQQSKSFHLEKYQAMLW